MMILILFGRMPPLNFSEIEGPIYPRENFTKCRLYLDTDCIIKYLRVCGFVTVLRVWLRGYSYKHLWNRGERYPREKFIKLRMKSCKSSHSKYQIKIIKTLLICTMFKVQANLHPSWSMPSINLSKICGRVIPLKIL